MLISGEAVVYCRLHRAQLCSPCLYPNVLLASPLIYALYSKILIFTIIEPIPWIYRIVMMIFTFTNFVTTYENVD